MTGNDIANAIVTRMGGRVLYALLAALAVGFVIGAIIL